jgi:tetratricopeptide (TPR) repeat protein
LESAEAQYLLGTIYSELGQVDLARHHLENALQLTPENGPSILQLGLLAASQERAEEALTYFERAIELMPEDARAHFRLGEALQYLREMSAAEEALRTAIILNPELPGTRLQLGMLYLETSRNDAALAELTRAAALAPNNATIRHQLGRAAMEVGDESTAEREFEAALQLDSFLSEAYLALGNLMVRQGQSERGRGLLTRFRDLQRDEATIASMLARLSETPSDPVAQRSLLSYLLGRDRHEQALDTVVGWIAGGLSPCNDLSAVYKAAVPASDNPSAVLLGLGQLLLECSNLTDAITYLEQAQSSGPESIELLLALARAYDQIGQPETAARLRTEARALRTPR